MADTSSYTKQKQLKTAQSRANPCKYSSILLNRALIFTIFLVILPLFPAQAPEFINQTLLHRSWELFHLLFFGIAISYGLFSRRNDETGKENGNNNSSKFDNAHAYVSRFVQVSSVFDDESENLSGSDVNSKVQTWNNQHHRHEVPIVVATEQSVLDEQRRVSSRITGRPLLLPVRRLKSDPFDGKDVGNCKGLSANSTSVDGSAQISGSKRFSSNVNKAKNGRHEGLNHFNFEENLCENVVLPSPIPWRSRSGKMEVKGLEEQVDSSPAMEESELSRPQSSRTNFTSSSQKRFSRSRSLSSESQFNGAEEMVRKKLYYVSTPPPPPPPPPPMVSRSSSMKASCNEDEDMNGYGKYGEKTLMSRANSSVQLRQRGCYVASTMVKTIRTTRLSNSPKQRYGEGMEKGREMEFKEQEEQELVEKVIIEKDEESESEDEEEEEEEEESRRGSYVSSNGGGSSKQERCSSDAIDGEACDVDKKADEFIAKIREQIRLQRIDSIKRSSGQIKRNSSR